MLTRSGENALFMTKMKLFINPGNPGGLPPHRAGLQDTHAGLQDPGRELSSSGTSPIHSRPPKPGETEVAKVSSPDRCLSVKGLILEQPSPPQVSGLRLPGASECL
ncbi:unnamed protein product [Lota lota]